MKYQRTQSALLKAIVLMLADKFPPRFGAIFQKWALDQMEEKYPLFHWALTRKP